MWSAFILTRKAPIFIACAPYSFSDLCTLSQKDFNFAHTAISCFSESKFFGASFFLTKACTATFPSPPFYRPSSRPLHKKPLFITFILNMLNFTFVQGCKLWCTKSKSLQRNKILLHLPFHLYH